MEAHNQTTAKLQTCHIDKLLHAMFGGETISPSKSTEDTSEEPESQT